MTEFLVAVFACYRLTRLLTWDLGPFDIFARLRDKAGVGLPAQLTPFWGKLLGCPYCTGFWVALPLALFVPVFFPVAWLGIAGGQFLLEQLTHGNDIQGD